jgi:hypothetical protein
MNQLRTRLIAVFVLATVVPLGLTLWTTLQLVDSSLGLAPLAELQDVTGSLESTGRVLYQRLGNHCGAMQRRAGHSCGGRTPGCRGRREFVSADTTVTQCLVRRGINSLCSRPLGFRKEAHRRSRTRAALGPRSRDVALAQPHVDCGRQGCG